VRGRRWVGPRTPRTAAPCCTRCCEAILRTWWVVSAPARTVTIMSAAVPAPFAVPVLPALGALRPSWRGRLHLATVPVALVLAVLYVTLAGTDIGRYAAGGWGASAIVLFAVSAIYHDRVWGPKVHAVLSRMDHANIFVFIAGSYTPFGLIALHGTEQKIGCGIVWTSCAVSAIMRILWSSTPRWLIVGLCMGIGAAAGAAGDQMLNAAGPAVVALLVAGGLLYSIGGIVYGLKRPNPWPAHFGFHEIFHACTLGAFALHAIAVGLLIL
jgi:hemolysin III